MPIQFLWAYSQIFYYRLRFILTFSKMFIQWDALREWRSYGDQTSRIAPYLKTPPFTLIDLEMLQFRGGSNILEAIQKIQTFWRQSKQKICATTTLWRLVMLCNSMPDRKTEGSQSIFMASFFWCQRTQRAVGAFKTPPLFAQIFFTVSLLFVFFLVPCGWLDRGRRRLASNQHFA